MAKKTRVRGGVKKAVPKNVRAERPTRRVERAAERAGIKTAEAESTPVSMMGVAERMVLKRTIDEGRGSLAEGGSFSSVGALLKEGFDTFGGDGQSYRELALQALLDEVTIINALIASTNIYGDGIERELERVLHRAITRVDVATALDRRAAEVSR